MTHLRVSAAVSGACVAVGAALALCALTASTALADPPQIAVVVHQASGAPSSYFTVAAQPGQEATAGSLAIENLTDHAVVVQLSPVNALTMSTLGSAYQTAGGELSGAARWLQLSAGSLPLAPEATGSIEVSVSVPSSASPGDYLAGISVLSTDQAGPAPGGGTAQLAQEDRYAVGVETQLPGARHPHLGFSGASVERDPSALVFNLLAHNDGNVIVTGVSGHATVSRQGHLVVAQAITPGSFVTGTQIAIPVRAPGENPSPGTVYRVQAELDYPGGPAYLDTLVTFGHAPPPPPRGNPSAGAPAGTGRQRPVTSSVPVAGPQPSPVTPQAPARQTRPTPRPRHRGARPVSGRVNATTAPVHRLTLVAPRRPDSDGTLGAFARAVRAVAERAAFPALLIVVMALFFLLQDRIDRSDPKLALAPVHADPQLDFA